MSKLIIENNVRTQRFLHGEMTQKDLARAVGVSRQTIVAIEKGQYSPSLELAFRLAMAFNTTVDELFHATEEK